MKPITSTELSIVLEVEIESLSGDYPNIEFLPPLPDAKRAIALQLLRDGVPDDWEPGPWQYWQEFYDALLISAPFQHARAVARTNLATNVSYTDLANALGKASMGSPNIAAIQAGYDNLKADLQEAGQPFDAEDLAELIGLGEEFNIPLVW